MDLTSSKGSLQLSMDRSPRAGATDDMKRFSETYRLTKEILDEGAFSIVHKGINRQTQQAVAVKVLRKDRVATSYKDTLLSEITRLLDIRHPHIVSYIDAFDAGKELYIVTEIRGNRTLFDEIEEKGAYSEQASQQAISGLVDAVACLHSHQISNLDLKPEELFLGKDDATFRITDFGLSHLLDQERMHLTATGTPVYLSPETLSGQPQGTAADMWAVGIVAYVLLSGFPPFTAEDVAMLLEQIFEGRYDFPAEYWSHISPAAKDFISKLLVVAPEGRLTAQDAMQHPWLSKAASSTSPSSTSTSTPTSTSTTSPKSTT